MASKLAQPNSGAVTKSVSFNSVPATGQQMMRIEPGVDAFYAKNKASALLVAVHSMLQDAVGAGEGLGPDAAFLCAFALDAASALNDATRGG